MQNNVEGPNCDRCKKNTYDLDPSNPQGCTNCFCSNRSTTCRASTFIWDQIRTASVENVKHQKCVSLSQLSSLKIILNKLGQQNAMLESSK